jgi:hypothetical protein
MDGVLYMMIGQKHAEHLAVSLYSLLKHWQGEVAILIGDKHAAEFCEPMGRLDRVRLVPFDYEAIKTKKRGSGNVYLAKTSMHKLTPFDRTIFLDADTLIAGDILDVLPEADEIKITQWMDWTTAGKMMTGRVKNWEEHAPKEAARQLAKPWPAINTGVIGFSKQCDKTMDAWAEMTSRNICFICDEIAMQLVFPDHPHEILDDRFNTSPCYEEVYRRRGGFTRQQLDVMSRYSVCAKPGDEVRRVITDATIKELSSFAGHPSDVRIWHGHGFKFIKKRYGRACWWPVYREAVDKNFCGIADWTPWNRGRWGGCKLLWYVDQHEKAKTW